MDRILFNSILVQAPPPVCKSERFHKMNFSKPFFQSVKSSEPSCSSGFLLNLTISNLKTGMFCYMATSATEGWEFPSTQLLGPNNATKTMRASPLWENQILSAFMPLDEGGVGFDHILL